MVNTDTLNKWVAPLAILAFGLLLLHNFISSGISFPGGSNKSTQLSRDSVRGSALVVKGVTYTLNFNQQVSVINVLGRAIAIGRDAISSDGQKPFFDKLIIYRFNQPDLIIQPLQQRVTSMLLDIPEWSETQYFLDTSSGELVNTLKEAFGP